MHSWRGERDPSVSVWSGQGPRLSPLSPPASSFSLPFLPLVLPCFQHSLFPLSRSHLGMFIRLSARFCPDAVALPRFLPNANIQTQMEMWETEKRGEGTAETHAFKNVDTHLGTHTEILCDDIFIQFLIRKLQKCPAWFARSRASPMSDASLVGAPTTLQVLKQNNHCAIPNKRPQKQ